MENLNNETPIVEEVKSGPGPSQVDNSELIKLRAEMDAISKEKEELANLLNETKERSMSPEEWQEHKKKLNDEAKTNRLKAKELEKALNEEREKNNEIINNLKESLVKDLSDEVKRIALLLPISEIPNYIATIKPKQTSQGVETPANVSVGKGAKTFAELRNNPYKSNNKFIGKTNG